MNRQELKLHIATPLGVVFDDFVAILVIKVHDGYRGVNKNQLPVIEKISMGMMQIKLLNQTTQKFLIGHGIMQVDKYECNIYTSFLISPHEIDNNQYLQNNSKILALIEDETEKKMFHQQHAKLEVALRKMRDE